MILVEIPYHLRTLAGVTGQVSLDIPDPLTLGSVLSALEEKYPMLRGTIRDHVTLKRRPFIRFFVAQQDWSDEPLDKLLPPDIVTGSAPFYVIGAIAGG